MSWTLPPCMQARQANVPFATGEAFKDFLQLFEGQRVQINASSPRGSWSLMEVAFSPVVAEEGGVR